MNDYVKDFIQGIVLGAVLMFMYLMLCNYLGV